MVLSLNVCIHMFCSAFTDVLLLFILFLKQDTKETEVSAIPQNSQLTWKQGRQLLRQ